MIINYDSFIVLATVMTIANYDSKTFVVQVTGNLDIYEMERVLF
jgi:hypothetical protein